VALNVEQIGGLPPQYYSGPVETNNSVERIKATGDFFANTSALIVQSGHLDPWACKRRNVDQRMSRLGRRVGRFGRCLLIVRGRALNSELYRSSCRTSRTPWNSRGT
jgi:hypothetical protein